MKEPVPALVATKQMIAQQLACSVRTVERRMQDDPRFPRAIRVGQRQMFLVEEVKTYLAGCVARREAEAETA